MLRFRGSPFTFPFNLHNRGSDGWFIRRCINSSTETFPSVKKIFATMIAATHPFRAAPLRRALLGSGGHGGMIVYLGVSLLRKTHSGIGLSTSTDGLLGLGRFPPVNSITCFIDGMSSMDPPQAMVGLPSADGGEVLAPWASHAVGNGTSEERVTNAYSPFTSSSSRRVSPSCPSNATKFSFGSLPKCNRQPVVVMTCLAEMRLAGQRGSSSTSGIIVAW